MSLERCSVDVVKVYNQLTSSIGITLNDVHGPQPISCRPSEQRQVPREDAILP